MSFTDYRRAMIRRRRWETLRHVASISFVTLACVACVAVIPATVALFLYAATH